MYTVHTCYDYKNRFTRRKKKETNQLTDFLLTHIMYKTSINNNGSYTHTVYEK